MATGESQSRFKRKLKALKQRLWKKRSSKTEDSFAFPLLVSPDGQTFGRPVKRSKLPGKIMEQFSLIITEINDYNGSQKVHDRILREVAANPILARTVIKNWSLLMILLCAHNLDPHVIMPAMKVLIQHNPASLLWQIDDTDIFSRPIHAIARFETICELMPWIAKNYAWVLDHPVLDKCPPSVELIRNFKLRSCSKDLMLSFFQTYPKALTQVDEKKSVPLQQMLCGDLNVDKDRFDLFMWMAKKNPDALLHRDDFNWTVLHYACGLIYVTEAKANVEVFQITKYLLEQNPEHVIVRDNHGGLPIHMLVGKYSRKNILEVDLLGSLLQICPDSYDSRGYANYTLPSSVPFLQKLKPILERTDTLLDERSRMEKLSTAFHAGIGEGSQPLSIYGSWIEQRINETKEKLNETDAEMEQVYNEFGGNRIKFSE